MRKYNIFPILLIIIGSFLEILFYIYRFINDGISIWLSTIIGFLLTLFLSLLMLKRNNKITWILIISLAIYSIAATSAGQSFSLAELHNKNIKSEVAEINLQTQIDEYLSDIEILDNEYNLLFNSISVDNINDRWKFEGVIKRAETRQNEIKEEKKEIQDKINTLRESQETTAELKKETTNIYQFYNKLFGFNANILQFILQTILSLFIAMAAPFGIILLTPQKPEPQKRKKKPIKIQKFNYNLYIEKFVHYCIIYQRQQKRKTMLDKRQFVDWMRTRYKNKKESILFTDQIFDRIKNTAIDKNIIDKNGIIINNESEEKIISILKESLNV